MKLTPRLRAILGTSCGALLGLGYWLFVGCHGT